MKKQNKENSFNSEKTLAICALEGANRDKAEELAETLGMGVCDAITDGLNVVFDGSGISLKGYGLNYQGDFESMLRRVKGGKLQHEMLVKASKNSGNCRLAIDATAGMGEDSFLLAANGFDVILYEQNTVVAALLEDALRRAMTNEELKDIVSRMHLVRGNSVEMMGQLNEQVDLIYLDPMFPERQKSGLINKKLQLIQKLEPPCSLEEELFEAAINVGPAKIIVKRPLKSPNLAGRKPGYTLNGKAIRYDCYVL